MNTQIFIKKDCVHSYSSVPYFTIIPYNKVVKGYSGEKVRLEYNERTFDVYTSSFEKSKENLKNKDYLFSPLGAFGKDNTSTNWLCAFYTPFDNQWNVRWVDRIYHSEFKNTINIECCFFRCEKPEKFLNKSISEQFNLGLNNCTTTFFFTQNQSRKVLNRIKKFYKEQGE